MMVYVASDYPLPLIPWDPSRPGFHVTKLPDRAAPVRRQFSKPHIYYVGSHEGCGCGFQYGEYEGFEDEADLPVKRDSRRRLAELLAVALQHQPQVELFACWDGDEGLLAEHTDRIRSGDLTEARTFFREKELLVVDESDAKG